MSDNEMTGGEAIARMIQAHEGGPMFGMGGFQLLPFYDAARRLGLQHHLINDERAGVFAADAYAGENERLVAMLARHLEDEEDLIVPLILERGEGAFGIG